MSVTSMEVRPVRRPRELIPARFSKARATEREKLPQEKEAASRTARNAEAREALHVCSAQSCQVQGAQPLLGKAPSSPFVMPDPISLQPAHTDPRFPFRAYCTCHRGPTSLADLGHVASLQPQN